MLNPTHLQHSLFSERSAAVERREQKIRNTMVHVPEAVGQQDSAAERMEREKVNTHNKHRSVFKTAVSANGAPRLSLRLM